LDANPPRGSYLALWLFPFTLENKGMELNGALSNPQAGVELFRLSAIRERLLRETAANPKQPRPSPPHPSPVLETITCVLERAGRPMRVREIHAAVCELAGEPLLWTSVKGALAGYTSGPERRFRRIRRGVYELAGSPGQTRSLEAAGGRVLT
jgi:hypothetical protein